MNDTYFIGQKQLGIHINDMMISSIYGRDVDPVVKQAIRDHNKGCTEALIYINPDEVEVAPAYAGDEAYVVSFVINGKYFPESDPIIQAINTVSENLSTMFYAVEALPEYQADCAETKRDNDRIWAERMSA